MIAALSFVGYHRFRLYNDPGFKDVVRGKTDFTTMLNDELNPVNTEMPTATITIKDLDTKFNGLSGTPSYISVKGLVHDVSAKDAYREGGGYHILAGKEASVAFGKFKLNAEFMEWGKHDVKDLTEKEMKTLDEWATFFWKKYPAVGILEEWASPVVKPKSQ